MAEPRSPDRLTPVLIAVVVVGALYLAREVLVPFALALLFAFLFNPIVAWMERKLGRVLSVFLVTVMFVLICATTTWIVSHQLLAVVNELPAYKNNIHNKIQTLHSSNGSSFAKASKSVRELNAELSAAPASSAPGTPGKNFAESPEKPVPVVIQPPSGIISELQAILGPVIAPLATALIVIVFTIFMLIKREDLRNRFLRLTGNERLNVVTLALDDAAGRVSKYLLMQLLVNCIYGSVFAIGLYFLKVPYALLWGVLATVLRFVPYIGTFIAAAMPTVLALAVFGGWAHAWLTFGLFIVLELVVANIVEPLLYGAHTGISALAILVSAVFWTLLWGPIGLILATPLTVCLLVASRFIPSLAFLNVLLGDEEVLSPEARFYQRLLAFDPEEAKEIADKHLELKSLPDLYDEVLIPSLRMAEVDRHQEALDAEREAFILQSVREMVEEWGEETEGDGKEDRLSPAKILCLPARDEADGITVTMLAQLLGLAGLTSESFPAGRFVGEMAQEISDQNVAIVCICALPPFAIPHARAVCKRLHLASPGVKIVVGVWRRASVPDQTEKRLKNAGADVVVSGLVEAVESLRQLAEVAIFSSSKNTKG